MLLLDTLPIAAWDAACRRYAAALPRHYGATLLDAYTDSL